MKHLLTICVAVLVLCSTTNAVTWNVPADFATIQEAIDSPVVSDGHTILVSAGSHFGATVTKAVEIKGEDGAVINNGPSPWNVSYLIAGFFFTGNDTNNDGIHDGSGATISHLRFETVEFPVFSRGADDITVEHCTMSNPIQGVTDWAGNGWQISHNVVTDLRTLNGGGIGILVGVPRIVQGTVSDNVVSHNKINGTLHVYANDGGGYNGTGIVLYADYRWGAAGPKVVTNTRVIKNKVSLVSDTPTVVDVGAIELTDTRNDDTLEPAIYDNAVGFNDLRGTTLQIALTPQILDNPTNKISRNLGENRGQGLHPSAFLGPDEKPQ